MEEQNNGCQGNVKVGRKVRKPKERKDEIQSLLSSYVSLTHSSIFRGTFFACIVLFCIEVMKSRRRLHMIVVANVKEQQPIGEFKTGTYGSL